MLVYTDRIKAYLALQNSREGLRIIFYVSGVLYHNSTGKKDYTKAFAVCLSLKGGGGNWKLCHVFVFR